MCTRLSRSPARKQCRTEMDARLFFRACLAAALIEFPGRARHASHIKVNLDGTVISCRR